MSAYGYVGCGGSRGPPGDPGQQGPDGQPGNNAAPGPLATAHVVTYISQTLPAENPVAWSEATIYGGAIQAVSVGDTGIVVAAPGVYNITYTISTAFTANPQVGLYINDVLHPNSVFGGAGVMTGIYVIPLAAGDVLSLRNHITLSNGGNLGLRFPPTTVVKELASMLLTLIIPFI